MRLIRKLHKAVKKIVEFIKDEDIVEKYRKQGVKIGENVHLINCNFDHGHQFLIEIGNNCTLTNCSLLTHDASTKKRLNYTKVGKIVIGNDCFIGWHTIILCNVHIGDKVIVGAGSVVCKDIPSNSVYAGNPARYICSYDEYMSKHERNLQEYPKFDVYWPNKSDEEKEEMKTALEHTFGYDL